MTKNVNCIVIGAGHNGLACAAYLAKAGKSVLVLEAQSQVGGAAATREFAPGYSVSSCAHFLHGLPLKLITELDLAKHGLQFAADSLPTYSLSAEGNAVKISNGAVSGGLLSEKDQAAYTAFMKKMNKFAAVMLHILNMVPPRLSLEEWSERINMLSIGWKVRTLGKRDMREFLRIIGMNMYDLLTEHFDNELLRGAIAMDAALGAEHGPRSPGTVLNYLYRLAGQVAAGKNGIAQPKGGMANLSGALANAVTGAGGTIRTNAKVERILVANDRVSGVLLASGETINATSVLSNADPQTTLLKILGTEHLDTGFVRSVHHIRNRGLAAKVHIALSGEPKFKGLSDEGTPARLIISPSIDYLELSFNPSKYREVPRNPSMEISIPTLADPALAPNGKHILSAIVQYVPYDLGADPKAARETLKENIISTLERYAPTIRSQITAFELLTPKDLEAEFGMSGGHWHHAALTFDQFFFTRPVPGAAQFETPLPGLYLCGAGAHPGGGVMGIAGRNAAKQLLRGGK
jgi:phytoene dehydrogenase-like protein